MNNCILIGHLGGDPAFKVLEGGLNVASGSIAVRDSWKVGTEWKERTDWIRVVAWGKLAERMREFQKGDLILVHGKIRERIWKDPEKKGEDRRSHEIEARVVQKIAKPPRRDEAPPTPEDAPPYAQADPEPATPDGCASDTTPF